MLAALPTLLPPDAQAQLRGFAERSAQLQLEWAAAILELARRLSATAEDEATWREVLGRAVVFQQVQYLNEHAAEELDVH